MSKSDTLAPKITKDKLAELVAQLIFEAWIVSRQPKSPKTKLTKSKKYEKQ